MSGECCCCWRNGLTYGVGEGGAPDALGSKTKGPDMGETAVDAKLQQIVLINRWQTGAPERQRQGVVQQLDGEAVQTEAVHEGYTTTVDSNQHSSGRAGDRFGDASASSYVRGTKVGRPCYRACLISNPSHGDERAPGRQGCHGYASGLPCPCGRAGTTLTAY
jgi:hypothetical protein